MATQFIVTSGRTGITKRETMQEERPRDWLEPLLARNLEWVRAADSKIAPILAIDTAMLGVAAALVPAVDDWSVVAAICAAIAALLLLTSLVFLVVASFPRLTGPKGSLLYFGGIADRRRDAYVEEIISVTDAQLSRDYAEQIHRNAEIADAKYGAVKYAMIALFASVLPWLVAVALLYSSGG